MPIPEPGCEHIPYLGADPCLGWLPGVVFACCGHGGESRAHVVIAGRTPETPASRLYADEALDYFKSIGVGPPEQRCSRPSDVRR
jgi:hypothetical protein